MKLGLQLGYWTQGPEDPIELVLEAEPEIVRAGRRVTFSVTNAGKLPHEFTLGDRATQLDHERQMRLMPATGGHVHSHGPTSSLTVPPGETRRLSWTFEEPGLVLYGCHVIGHWPAGGVSPETATSTYCRPPI